MKQLRPIVASRYVFVFPIALIMLLSSSMTIAATLTTDASDYAPGSTVTLTGSGFQSGETVTVQVLHNPTCCDDATSADHQPWEVTADADGGFITTWYVPADQDELGASLIATADGQSSGDHAEALFTDNNYATLDFQQPQNGTVAPWTLSWTNSGVSDANSTYYEGMAVPQRLIVTGIVTQAGNLHSCSFKTLAVGSNNHAIDFLTSWPQAMLAADSIGGGVGSQELQNLFSQACGTAISSQGATACSQLDGTNLPPILSGVYTAYPDIPDAMDSIGDTPPVPGTDPGVDGNITCFESKYGNRTLEIRGNAPITASAVAFNGYSNSGANSSYALYTITWTSASTNIMIRFATHLAVSNGNCGYGTQRGAGYINGGSTHVRLEGFDGNIGSLDNQVSAAAIAAPPPICTVSISPTSDSVCLGNSSELTISAIPNSGTPPYSFLWNTGDTTASIFITPTTSTTYSVTVTDANGQSCSSNQTITVTNFPLPDCSIDGGSDSIITGESTHWCAIDGMAEYVWTGPGGFSASTQCIDPVVGGDYTVEVFTEHGCNNTCTRNLTEIPCCKTPTGVAVTPLPNNHILVCWDSLQCVSGYITQYEWLHHPDWLEINTTGFEHCADIALKGHPDLRIEIAAICNDGDTTDFSDVILYHDDQPCTPPSDLFTTNITATTARLNWTQGTISGNQKVRYEEFYTGIAAHKRVLSAASSVKIKNLKPDTTYRWKVEGDCWSDYITFTTLSLKLANDLAGGDAVGRLSVYPNPVSQKFYADVQLDGDKDYPIVIEIVNAMGQVIFSQKDIAADGHCNTLIDLPAQSVDGLYTIRIVSELGTLDQRIVVSKSR